MGSEREGRSFGLRWRVERQEGVVNVALAGEFDLACVDALTEDAGTWSESPVVVFDLAELEFMDSTALRFFGQLKRDMDESGRRLLLARVSPPAVRLLSVAGLLDYFDYVDGVPPAEQPCPACGGSVTVGSARCDHCGAAL